MSPTTAAILSTTTVTTQDEDLRQRRVRRRLSTAPAKKAPSQLAICHTALPLAAETLELPAPSPIQTLASLRFLILSYLADLEKTLAELQLESPDLEAWKVAGEIKIDEAAQWAQTALEMLRRIREDVRSYLPDLHLADMTVEDFVKSHLPDFSDVQVISDVRSHLPDMPDVRSHLPEIPHFPDIPDVRSHLSDMRLKFDDVRSRLHDIDFRKPLQYIPTLSDHLQSLQSHLASMELPSGLGLPALTPSSKISRILDSILSSELVGDLIAAAPEMMDGEDVFEKLTFEVTKAVKRSLQGVRLIKYTDLPHPWRNNPFVTQGYRFIPLERWPLILMSLFAFHNEFLNIHTHLIPFVLWTINLIPFINSNLTTDTPEMIFTSFALLCLLSSAVWHTMSGCAHAASMDFCARIDYVGIGWLISASVGTVVYYGYQCHPNLGQNFLTLCFLTGLAGNIFPFMDWFNKHEYRIYRVAFFLTLAFSAIAPLAGMSIMHSTTEMFSFIGPVIPSLISYLIGLFFYVAHVPERFLTESVRKRLDYVGGGSHCIWHCFIVLAVSQHKTAISSMREGLKCLAN